MQTYSQSMTPGQAWRLGVPGSYFRLLDVLGAVTVVFYRQGVPVFTATDVLDGFWSKPSGGFDMVGITSATAQDVKIGITSGDAGYDRAAGSVDISNMTGAFTQEAATVTNASGQLLAARAGRRYLLIQNNDASGDVFVTLDGSAATTTNGVKIAAGGSLELAAYCPAGAVNAIGSLPSNASVIVVEG